MKQRKLRNWMDRRERHLRTACMEVATLVQSGTGVGHAIQLVAASFRGRKLDKSRYLRLSAGRLQDIWYASRRATDATPFRLRYWKRPRASTQRDPQFVLPLLHAAMRRGLSIGALLKLSRLKSVSLRLLNLTAARAAIRQRAAVRSAHYRKELLMRRPPNVPPKPRPLSKVAQLQPQQREQVDQWLLRENLIYREVADLIDRQFGVRVSPTALCAYYQSRSPQRSQKPRVHGKIASLTPDQRDSVHRWFRENLTYAAIARNIQGSFGLKLSQAALCAYYGNHYSEIFGPLEASR